MADLSDTEIRNILISHGKDVGPINSITRSGYLKTVKNLQNGNNKSTKLFRKSMSHSPKNVDLDRGNSPSPPSGDKYPKNVNITPPKRHEKSKASSHEFEQPNSDPKFVTYGSRTPPKHTYDHYYKQTTNQTPKTQPKPDFSPSKFELPHFADRTNTPMFNKPVKYIRQSNENNRGSKWYEGSIRSMSSYFSNRSDGQDMMDISDGDLSDNDSGSSTLITRLRKNYFKRSGWTDNKNSQCTPKSKSRFDLSHINLNLFPNILLLAFIVFSIILFSSYLLMKSRYSHTELDMAIERLVCTSPSQKNCFTESELPQFRFYLGRLYDILSEHAGEKMCEFSSDRQLSFSDARESLNVRLKHDKREYISNEQWSRLMSMIIALPSDKLNIIGYDRSREQVNVDEYAEEITYLEGMKPKRSLLCRTKMFIVHMISWMIYFMCFGLILLILLFIAYRLNIYRLKKKEIYERNLDEMRDIVSTISGLLQDQLNQAEYDGTSEKFMSLIKIRSILQQTHPKLRDNNFWDQVKRFMYKYEPLIELKETLAHGEILQWRCRPGWQGSAVQSQSQVKFDKGPTECLKIRNMDLQHDRFDEAGKNYLRREVINRIKDAGEVKDIRFATKGPKIIVYVLCASREVAGKAFRKINANYFNGNLLTVKFIRLDKYLERFPQAQIYVQ